MRYYNKAGNARTWNGTHSRKYNIITYKIVSSIYFHLKKKREREKELKKRKLCSDAESPFNNQNALQNRTLSSSIKLSVLAVFLIVIDATLSSWTYCRMPRSDICTVLCFERKEKTSVLIIRLYLVCSMYERVVFSTCHTAASVTLVHGHSGWSTQKIVWYQLACGSKSMQAPEDLASLETPVHIVVCILKMHELNR